MDLLGTHTGCPPAASVPCWNQFHVSYIFTAVSYPTQRGGVGTSPRTMVSLWQGAPGGKSLQLLLTM